MIIVEVINYCEQKKVYQSSDQNSAQIVNSWGVDFSRNNLYDATQSQGL